MSDLEPGTARFTPLDADGEPNGAPVFVPVAGMKVVSVQPVFDTGGEFGPLWHGERLYEQMIDVRDAFTGVGIATVNAIGSFSAFYDAIAAMVPPGQWRPSKAQRRAAKAKKLAQRRAAARGPRADWDEVFPSYRRTIGSIARRRDTRPHPRTGYVHIVRNPKPCVEIPCPPFNTIEEDS